MHCKASWYSRMMMMLMESKLNRYECRQGWKKCTMKKKIGRKRENNKNEQKNWNQGWKRHKSKRVAKLEWDNEQESGIFIDMIDNEETTFFFYYKSQCSLFNAHLYHCQYKMGMSNVVVRFDDDGKSSSWMRKSIYVLYNWNTSFAILNAGLQSFHKIIEHAR